MTRFNVDKDKRILVGLSGGVDSSVAAALLQEKGYEVEGAYLRCWSEGPYCNADQDEADAARVAAKLNIPFQVLNFEKEYKKEVIDYFYAEYAAGRTPNPDVMCNKEIKFGLFLKKARKLGFDYIATGHYARISNSSLHTSPDANRDQYSQLLRPLRGLQQLETRDQESGNWSLVTENSKHNGNGRANGYSYELLTGVDYSKDQSLVQYQLLAGLDPDKDQSYFLYLVGQDQLAHTLFPLGDLKKTQVRKLAKKYKLPTAKKPDSMGICFVGHVDIREFLAQKIKYSHGDIVSVDGKVLGRHIGLPFYTIGQREGLGVSTHVPQYVVGKDAKNNELIIVPFGHKSLFKDKFRASGTHWVSGDEPKFPKKVEVKLRYRAPNAKASVKKMGEGSVEVKLEKPQRAITPGQSAVFYDGDKVIGGAVVDGTIG